MLLLLCWVSVASGPFTLKLGLRWVKWVETHFSPTLNSFLDFSENFFASLRGWRLFSKKGPEAVPTQHHTVAVSEISLGYLFGSNGIQKSA